jgi:bacillopeptidase F (M6 metalloprotease family)
MVVGLAGAAVAASAAPVALHCMNTTSGATWDIPVDMAQGTVDSVPAQITGADIVWKDATFHHYDFDRQTGLLDMHVASSTGGFYLTDRCVLK